jgi:ribosomal protein L18E
MSSKTKKRKTSPAWAFYSKAEQTEKKVKEEIERILKAPRYKHYPVRVLKIDGKRKSRKSTKRKSKSKINKRKRSKSKK